MGSGGAVLDHHHLLAFEDRFVVTQEREPGVDADDPGLRIELGGECLFRSDVCGLRAAALGDEDHVGHADLGFGRVIGAAVARSVGVHEDDVHVGLDEGDVVVAAVPENEIGFLLGRSEDGWVVDAGVDDATPLDVGLVLLPFLDGALVPYQVVVGGETLHGLGREVAVGHGVTDADGLEATLVEQVDEVARGLRLSAPGAHRSDAEHGLVRGDHGACAGKHEVGADGIATGREGGNVLPGDVGVREYELFHTFFDGETLEVVLGHDWDAVGIPRPGELGWKDPIVDPRNLGRGEGNHLDIGIVSIEHDVIVKVAASRTEDGDTHGISC